MTVQIRDNKKCFVVAGAHFQAVDSTAFRVAALVGSGKPPLATDLDAALPRHPRTKNYARVLKILGMTRMLSSPHQKSRFGLPGSSACDERRSC